MPVEFRAALHIHTCLSPCAELSMTPSRIVEKAASLGLNILAVCDHNTVEHVEVTSEIAKKGHQGHCRHRDKFRGRSPCPWSL